SSESLEPWRSETAEGEMWAYVGNGHTLKPPGRANRSSVPLVREVAVTRRPFRPISHEFDRETYRGGGQDSVGPNHLRSHPGVSVPFCFLRKSSLRDESQTAHAWIPGHGKK